MIKKIILIITLIISLITNSFAFELGSIINSISKFGTVENTADFLCIHRNDKSLNFEADYKRICQIVKKSELCQKIPKEDQLKCNDSKENEIDVTSLSFIYECSSGLWNSLKDLFQFIVGGIKGILGYTFDSDQRDKFHKAVGQYYDSFSNYLAIEYDKEQEKTDSDFKAIYNVAGGLLKTLMTKLGEEIKENYFNLGCYSQEARQERVCKIVGDIIMPPAAAIGLIFKGSKYSLKALDVISKKGGEAKKIFKENPIPLTPPISKDIEGLKLKNTEKLSDASKTQINDWLKSLKPNELEKFKKLQDKFSKDLHEYDSRNSLLFSVKDEMSFSQEAAVKDLLDYYSISVKSNSSGEKFKKFNNWVKSDAHALYLYDQMAKEGLEKNKDLLRYLTNYNEYFKKAHGLRGPPNSLITYSFEKESSKSEISLWFKKAGMSDEEWLKLSEEERLKLLKEATDVKKDKVSESKIESTGLKPHYVGNYSEELGHNAQDKSYSWEIANKKYEISLDRTLNQVKEVSKSFKETHSFHTHIVFDIPKDYKEFEKFQAWSKSVNDYLYLKGMEEGLHGNYLTSVAHLPEDAPKRINSHVNNELPSALSSVSETSHKFFSMGIRGELYGPSSVPNNIKLGLELRDTTRNLDILSDNMKTITSSVQDYKWEKWNNSINRKDVTFVRPNFDLVDANLAAKVSPAFLQRIKKGDINATIPLQKFETGEYFDFNTGKKFTPSKEQQERIAKAREYYIEEMHKIEKDMHRMDEKGISYSKEDVDDAIKMTMSEWARMARVSELFKGH